MNKIYEEIPYILTGMIGAILLAYYLRPKPSTKPVAPSKTTAFGVRG